MRKAANFKAYRAWAGMASRLGARLLAVSQVATAYIAALVVGAESKIRVFAQPVIVSEEINIGIVGAAGYTGHELLRLLRRHPGARLRQVCSRSLAGKAIDSCYPQLAPWSKPFDDISIEALSQCDVVFFATPTGVCQEHAPALIDAGVCIIDLSADFRIPDIPVWEGWYQCTHKAPELAQSAVYGLTEFARERIATAQLIANPGCYPTVVGLALAPLVEAGAVLPGPIIADCKSGASGAGRALREHMLYGELNESVNAYAITGHRHQAEIDSIIGAGEVSVQFVPHILPMHRGMLATMYLRSGRSCEELHSLMSERYQSEPFIHILAPGLNLRTADVCHTNLCAMALYPGRQSDIVLVISAIDNLVKGAAGQAVQNMNCRFSWPEGTALAPHPDTA